MRKLLLIPAVLLLALSVAAQTAPQPCSSTKPDEKKMQRPSPPACTDVKFADGKMIVIQYSQPGINDPKTKQPRVVWGQLVPWDAVWRMGANEATSFTSDVDLMVGGTRVPAGSYSLDLLPQQKGPWKLIINKTTGKWGIPYPGADSDLARIDMKKPSTLPDTVERFTMKLAPAKGGATTLSLEWEKTAATIDIKEAK